MPRPVLTPLAVVVLSLGAVSCTKVLYEGPRRPSADVALIETDDATIDRVDGQELGGVSKVELLPGFHAVGAHMSAWTSGYNALIHTTSGSLILCLKARPGHVYLLRPARFGDLWGPEIIDENVTQRVAMRAPGDPSGCTEQ